MTHCTEPADAPSPRSMDGNATFTMLTSRSVISVASWQTANARQRLGSAPSPGESGELVWAAVGAAPCDLTASCSRGAACSRVELLMATPALAAGRSPDGSTTHPWVRKDQTAASFAVTAPECSGYAVRWSSPAPHV